MKTVQYPADLIVTERDFRDSDWREIVGGMNDKGYWPLYQAFSAASNIALVDGRNSTAKVYGLLANACSMLLTPESSNEPFKPLWVFGAHHASVPDDFSRTDLSFFSEIVGEIDEPWLKARIADLTWLTRANCDIHIALTAIDAYCSIPLSAESMFKGGRECWARAIQLARLLRGAAGERVAKMETAIIEALISATREDGFLGLELAGLLDSHQLGRTHCAEIAKKLESLAKEVQADGNLYQAREYFAAACTWYRYAKDPARAALMKASEAEGWASEAIASISSSTPSHIAAVAHLEKAIQVYREIPKKDRGSHRADDRIEELRRLLNESGQQSLEEMNLIEGPSIDLTALSEKARLQVAGKPPADALRAFCSLHQWTDVEQARLTAIEGIRAHPLFSLISARVLSADGRVVAKRGAVKAEDLLADGDQDAISAAMIRNHCIGIDVVVHGLIVPALEVLWLEHRLNAADFINLAREAPIVPDDRAILFGKGLYAGYDRDFITAAHLLAPQIEHLIRYHMKQAGETTTTIGNDGVEGEKSLSKLMTSPSANMIFGENLCFEIQALFCSPLGPNLRNEIAHGLLDDAARQSGYLIYAWWLCLKLAFTSLWHLGQCRDHGSNVHQAP